MADFPHSMYSSFAFSCQYQNFYSTCSAVTVHLINWFLCHHSWKVDYLFDKRSFHFVRVSPVSRKKNKIEKNVINFIGVKLNIPLKKCIVPCKQSLHVFHEVDFWYRHRSYENFMMRFCRHHSVWVFSFGCQFTVGFAAATIYTA